ncbi:MAG: hypothetical protein ACR2MO_06585 [Acidimicrobiales bacterium]
MTTNSEAEVAKAKVALAKTRAKLYTDVPMWLATGLAVAGALVLVFLSDINAGASLYFIAPIQIVVGSAIVMSLFLLVAIGFRRMGIHDKTHALGLPDGSIRALIAIILLVIFFVLSNVIFGVLQQPGTRSGFSRVPRSDVEAMQRENPGLLTSPQS